MIPARWTDADEGAHADAAVEAWWFWGWTPDGRTGNYIGFEVRGRRFDYWAGLVREGKPYLYVEELDGDGRRAGLEIKPPEMWADHVVDVPMRQWSLGNEAHGVLLDDPDEAWRRAHGTPVPVAFDVEWHASAAPVAIDGGYQQAGEVDARVELTDGVLEIIGAGHRVHVWGRPFIPSTHAMPVVEVSMRAPYRRHDGRLVDQVLGRSGWRGRVVGTRA